MPVKFNPLIHSGFDFAGSGGGGSGTVTSVGLADSTGLFNITGSPVTTTGTLTLASFMSQLANRAFIAPNGAPGAPTFRLLVAADLPSSIPSSVGVFGSTPNNAGAVISGQVLTLEPADGTHPGGVSITTQTFAGDKTFSGTITASTLTQGQVVFPGVGGVLTGSVNLFWDNTNRRFSVGPSHTMGGIDSSAFGSGNTATGDYSHAEGSGTIASGQYSHAEGQDSEATGFGSHAEGNTAKAENDYSHAEGSNTIASGARSHAEGSQTNATGDNSHTEGFQTAANGLSSHAEGDQTQAVGDHSHAEGSSTFANAADSHAEGNGTVADGISSHAEGNGSTAGGLNSHAEGNSTTASGNNSHSEGSLTQATAAAAHSEGLSTIASGTNSHAEGRSTTASNQEAHAEGRSTTASGQRAHAEGSSTQAIGTNSHSQNALTIATGDNSHAGGHSSVATPTESFAHGEHCITDSTAVVKAQAVLGKYNVENATDQFIVGIGTGVGLELNGFAVGTDGLITMDQGGQRIKSRVDVNDTITIDPRTDYNVIFNSTNPITIALPPGVNGMEYQIKCGISNPDATNVINADGADTFEDGSSSLLINKPFQSFILTFNSGFWYILDESSPISSGSYNVQKYTLDGTDISNAFVTLSTIPTTANLTRLTVIGGIEQEYSVDFTVSGTQLSWSGLGLDGVLVSGDRLVVAYN